MKLSRIQTIDYLLQAFSHPKVKDEIARYARAFAGEASRFSTGMMGEAAETRESFAILAKYIRNEKLTSQEKKHFKHQVIDILKGAGVVVPVMLIPLPFISTILLIIMDHLLQSMNIQILPASFYPPDKKELLTKEGIEQELKKKVHNHGHLRHVNRNGDKWDDQNQSQ